MRVAAGASRMVPAPVGRWVAETAAVGVSRLGRRSGWRERRAMLARHLRRTGSGSERSVDEALASYARYWAESLRVPHLSQDRIRAGIRYDGYERISGALEKGRGVILALPHLGGWEWAGAHLAGEGHRVSVVVERLEPADLFEWFVGFRSAMGMDVIPIGPDSAARCASALAANHILCLLSDRVVGSAAGIEVPFFGEETVLPAGPALLALRTGAPLLPCAVYFEAGTEKHLGVVLPALDTTRRGTIREDAKRVTSDLARAFEELIRRAPAQWHLLQPNWPSDR